MKKFIFLSALSLGFMTTTIAQKRIECGTTFEELKLIEPDLIANIQALKDNPAVTERGAFLYVPVFFHLVGDAQGKGRIKEKIILDELCKINAKFAPLEIRFYLSPHPTLGLFDYTISSNNVYTNQSDVFLMNLKKHPNALNYYMVDVAASSNNQPGEAAAYYSRTRDWIVCRKDELGKDASTLIHETGHFFSLEHTFYGWERDAQNADEPPCFEAGDPGWPVAPATSPLGIPTERVNRTNCATSGDYICDTPPDYNFGYCDETGKCAVYAGGAQDPLSQVVDPMETNYMSYYFGCNFQFTNGQRDAMRTDINSFRRNFLDNTYAPEAETITVPTDLLQSPASSATVPFYDEVTLQWKQVTGATYYLIEIDINNSFTTQLSRSYTTASTSLFLNDLQPGRTYFWRVRPFNQYATCALPRLRSFSTSQTSTVAARIPQLNSWTVSPNPAQEGLPLTLHIQAAESFKASIGLYNASGALIRSIPRREFPSGETFVELPISDVPNGLYFAALESGKGRSVKKVAIFK